MTLGTKLSELRLKVQLTQSQLAEKLDISQVAYNKWESDLAKPTMENLLKLCDFYQVDVYKLLENVSNVNFSKSKFDGSSYAGYANNFTVNITQPEVLQSVLENQSKISELVENQNKLIERLLSK